MLRKTTKYWELFLKQKNGSISEDQLSDLNNWKNINIDNEELIREFETIYTDSTRENIPDFIPKENWDEVQTMIKADLQSNVSMTGRLFPWIARVAAAAILILGFTFIYYQYKSISSEDRNIQVMAQSDGSGIKVVNLPDGSTVWLNKNSELLYPEIFESNTRKLYLRGEAFFEVRTDENKPFIIHSGSSKTTVLGTSFNLRAYDREDKITLTVVAGKVSFTLPDDREGMTVTAGHLAILENETLQMSQSRNEDRNFLSWKTGELVFDDIPLGHLIDAIERHYYVDIEVEDQHTLNCRFTGNFKETEIESTIKVITRAIGTTYKKSEDSYLIQGSGCR